MSYRLTIFEFADKPLIRLSGNENMHMQSAKKSSAQICRIYFHPYPYKFFFLQDRSEEAILTFFRTIRQYSSVVQPSNNLLYKILISSLLRSLFTHFHSLAGITVSEEKIEFSGNQDSKSCITPHYGRNFLLQFLTMPEKYHGCLIELQIKNHLS